MKRAAPARKETLAETLKTLEAFGLLDRTLKLKVGETEVLMDVKAAEPEKEEFESTKARTEREALELADSLYGASRGGIPGVQ